MSKNICVYGFLFLVSVMVFSCSSPTGSGVGRFPNVPSGEIVPVEMRDQVLTGISGDTLTNKIAQAQKWWLQISSNIDYTNCGDLTDEVIENEDAWYAFTTEGELLYREGENGTSFSIAGWEWTSDQKNAITINEFDSVEFELRALNEEELIYASYQEGEDGCSATTWEEFGIEGGSDNGDDTGDDPGNGAGNLLINAPADSSRLVPTDITLEWGMSDAVPADEIYYTLYLSTSYDSIPDPVFYDSLNVTSYDVELGTNASYFWYVEAYDADGNFLDDTKKHIFTTAGEHFNVNIPMVSIPSGDYRFGEAGTSYNMDYSYKISNHEIWNGLYVELLNSLVGSSKIQITKTHVYADMDEYYYSEWASVDAGNYALLDISPSSRIHFNETNQTFSIDYGYVDHPVNRVSWHGALFFALEKGYTLPTKYEWERAARGNTDRTYPWGDEAVGCVLVNHQGCQTTGTDEVGGSELSIGRSYYEVTNMAGNVAEWTQTNVFSPVLLQFVVKGGSFLSPDDSDNMKVWGEAELGASGMFVDVGFRVAEAPAVGERQPFKR